MHFPDSFFEDEVRCGFYVPALMKRSWAAQIEILADVARICEKHNIKWYADGGTLLGAVRHRGFIPWDDDLDICMFREDYIRFKAVVENELPDGYYIPKDRGDDYRLLITICSGTPVCLEQEHLEKFHHFPFSPGIDVFALDYVAPDPDDEELRSSLASIVWHTAEQVNEANRNTAESRASVEKVEELLNVKLDQGKPLKDQLFALLENVFSLYTAQEAKEATFMPSMLKNPSYRFPVECYQETILLPFESVRIPAPALYDKVLKAEYGDYQRLSHAGGQHEYPYFRSLEKYLTEQEDSPLPGYTISSDDMEKKREASIHPQKLVDDFVQLIEKIHKKICQSLRDNHVDLAREYLEASQNSAVRIGAMIEQIEGKDFGTVKLLEQYCELLYQIYEKIHRGEFSADSIGARMDEMLLLIQNSTSDPVGGKKEILFLPYKASLWNGLEPIWKKMRDNPEYHVSVIPVPYYFKSPDGSPADIRYEGDLFPDYVPVIDYSSYNFKIRQSYRIFIHNPYDEYNLTTSVHPFFYARNLKKYTDKLIYVPCFPLDEIARDDWKSWYNMRYYVSMPGPVHADQVMVQSEWMQQIYIDYLTEFAGEDTRKIWEEKVRVINDIV